MDSVETSKPHAVCVPFPAQGHMGPMMQLAKLLHSRGFFITFVNTEFNHRRLIKSKGPASVKGLPDFRFETIPDGLPPSNPDATQDIPALCDSTRKNLLAPFLELVKKLNSSPQVPNVTCIISDGVMSFGIKAAQVLGIQQVQFWTASACSFMGYLQYSELLKRGIFPFQNETFLTDGTLEKPIDWIPGMSNIRFRDIPSFIRANDPNDTFFDFMKSEVENCLKAPAIIINTFDEYENEVLKAIAAKFPRIYTIGPLHLLARHMPDSPSKSMSLSLWKEDTSCIEWLNTMEPNSVVYVNYGSLMVMSSHHLKEFAWGLANSKFPFLWILRDDVVLGESAILPKEFMEEIEGRGFITSWCPQQQVLCHPAIGVFLTHCGWNSLMEAVSEGVPLISWPFFADQQTNCRYSCTTWGTATEIDPDVKRDDVEALVKEMMEGDNGKRMRRNALEWKRKAEAAVSVGGSSVTNFDRIIQEALRDG